MHIQNSGSTSNEKWVMCLGFYHIIRSMLVEKNSIPYVPLCFQGNQCNWIPIFNRKNGKCSTGLLIMLMSIPIQMKFPNENDCQAYNNFFNGRRIFVIWPKNTMYIYIYLPHVWGTARELLWIVFWFSGYNVLTPGTQPLAVGSGAPVRSIEKTSSLHLPY